jgi:hypothetical protein
MFQYSLFQSLTEQVWKLHGLIRYVPLLATIVSSIYYSIKELETLVTLSETGRSNVTDYEQYYLLGCVLSEIPTYISQNIPVPTS